jgi:hypothetical protein
MRLAIMLGEFVVLADVFTNQAKVTRLDAHPNFLLAFTLQSLLQSLSVVLTAAR